MEWNVSELYMLGAASCTNCNGSGIHRVNKGELVPCGCALRAVFRACHQRFRISLGRGHCRTASFERNPRGKTHRNSWSRKEEEYIADFELVSRRHLDAFHYKIFRYHFLLGADWKLYGRRFGINRGAFYHAVYRIEEHLGRIFYELEPYALYPPRDYFAVRLKTAVKPCTQPPKADRAMPRRPYELGRGEDILPLAV